MKKNTQDKVRLARTQQRTKFRKIQVSPLINSATVTSNPVETCGRFAKNLEGPAACFKNKCTNISFGYLNL